ncbi:MAG: DNA adenine methylase [Desulfosporosinus sp.]|nr:DNA adenine methylase [Desulfosporosinus sp.]
MVGTSEVKRAVRFYYILHFSFGAKMQSFIISPTEKPPNVLKSLEDKIRTTKERLQNTIIEHRDFGQVISSYDRLGTIFYCDPPYFSLSGYGSQGSKPFTKEDHVRLRDCLSGIQGKFLLSINDHPETKRLYAGFNIEEVKVKYSICKSDKGLIYKELLISNYVTPTESGKDNAV